MVEAHASILRYFSLVDKVPGYQELPIIIPEGGIEQEGIEGGWGDTASLGDEVKKGKKSEEESEEKSEEKPIETSEEKKITKTEEELVEK